MAVAAVSMHAQCAGRPGHRRAGGGASTPPHRRSLQLAVSCSSSSENAAPSTLSRRQQLAAAAAAAAFLPAGQPRAASASKLPQAVDETWERLGGGPADLVFPPSFQGVWDVQSVLQSLELPMGPEAVPDMTVVTRAQQQDLGRAMRYQVAFRANARGQVVADRAFNTASLLAAYSGLAAGELQRRIRWNADDPNLLLVDLPGGLQASTRVTRRSQESAEANRLTTSELIQEVLTSPSSPVPRVKASRCLTKYLWRSPDEAAAASTAAAAASGPDDSSMATAAAPPEIVATQVVSDYLASGFADPAMLLSAAGRPHSVYTYRMAFWRAVPAQQLAGVP